MTRYLSISVKMLQYNNQASFSCFDHIDEKIIGICFKLLRKHYFVLNDKFFVNFCKNASKQQKSLVYIAKFIEKNTFLP